MGLTGTKLASGDVASVEIAKKVLAPMLLHSAKCSSPVLLLNSLVPAGPKSIRVVERLRDGKLDYFGGIK